MPVGETDCQRRIQTLELHPRQHAIDSCLQIVGRLNRINCIITVITVNVAVQARKRRQLPQSVARYNPKLTLTIIMIIIASIPVAQVVVLPMSTT